MSIENAKKFMAMVAKGSELKVKLATCTSPEERFALAKNFGYEFNAVELNHAKTELTDGELDTIAGGSCCAKACENEPCCEGMGGHPCEYS